jgi:hypothetical protein
MAVCGPVRVINDFFRYSGHFQMSFAFLSHETGCGVRSRGSTLKTTCHRASNHSDWSCHVTWWFIDWCLVWVNLGWIPCVNRNWLPPAMAAVTVATTCGQSTGYLSIYVMLTGPIIILLDPNLPFNFAKPCPWISAVFCYFDLSRFSICLAASGKQDYSQNNLSYLSSDPWPSRSNLFDWAFKIYPHFFLSNQSWCGFEPNPWASQLHSGVKRRNSFL